MLLIRESNVSNLQALLQETTEPYDLACMKLEDLKQRVVCEAPQLIAELLQIQSLLLKSAYPFDELVAQIVKEPTMSSIRGNAAVNLQEEDLIPYQAVTITIKGNRATIKKFRRDTYNVFGARYGIRPPYTDASAEAKALSQALQNPEWTLSGAMLTVDDKAAEFLPKSFVSFARKIGLEVNLDEQSTAKNHNEPADHLVNEGGSRILEHIRARTFQRRSPIKKTGEIRPTF